MSYNWQKQQEKEIKRFTKGWNWERVFQTWLKHMKNSPISVNSLFREVIIHDPGLCLDTDKRDLIIECFGERSEFSRVAHHIDLSWWPPESIFQHQKNLQRHFDDYPGTHGLIHPYYFRKGEIDTIYYLWKYKDDLQKVCALLISASLFYRLESHRREYPRDTWPNFYCVRVLLDWCYEQSLDEDKRRGWYWAGTCTRVIPKSLWDYSGCQIKTMNELIRYIAEEHIQLFKTFQPVVIRFKPEPDSVIASILKEEYEIERQKREEAQKLWAIQQKTREEELERQKIKHSRLGEWNQISYSELQTLVWSKPTQAIADEFGISDVAIAKKCNRLGIGKPPRGFWAKVNAGKLPHPKGKPLEN